MRPDGPVFTDTTGRTLTMQDLLGATGKVQWASIGSESVPAEARQLHQKARIAGTRGDYRRALELLGRARALAPGWPYPVYDAAYTYLLQGDARAAEGLYAEVDRLSPRGFLACQTTLYGLRRERTGELPAGFCRTFATLEWLDDLPKKKAILEGIVEKYPGFAPAWKELAALLVDADARWQAITKGLDAGPDGETRGMLLIYKALMLLLRGERQEAIRLLGVLALNPVSTLATEALAKATLARVVQQAAGSS
jgi:tetratricopeptide (TPR) repeat protein